MGSQRHNEIFICKNCGFQSLKWFCRCPDCGEWNALIEKKEEGSRYSSLAQPPLPIRQVPSGEADRLKTSIDEFDRVLGGGLVKGSCVLISGEPGIGKSTLLLQVAHRIAEQGLRVLYLSGEEAPSQLRMRAERTGSLTGDLLVSFQGDVEEIISSAETTSPQLLIVDSIQTVYLRELQAAPGSVLQVRECASRLFSFIKEKGIPLILVGHVTKEGSIAGPKLLEHLVDVVLYFEGERYRPTRILRCQKNRFGDTSEIGLFEMCGAGLSEIKEADQVLLPARGSWSSGKVITAALEGARVLLIEVQALASQSYLSIPRRVTNGFDYNRLLMILAVLEKSGQRLGEKDVYVNVMGGFSLDDPAADLSVALAITSSLRDFSIPPLVALGELGLSGEIRPIPALDKRMQTAARLGFDQFLVPVREGHISQLNGISLWEKSSLKEAIAVLKEISKERQIE